MALSPTSSRGSSGGSSPQTRSTYGAGAPVTIANNAGAALPWGTQFGNALLDLTTPTAPTIVTTGVYAVSVVVASSGNMTANGFYNLSLELDTLGDDPAISVDSRLATAANLVPQTAVTLVYYVPAAGVLKVFVSSDDGAASRDFQIAGASVQRLS